MKFICVVSIVLLFSCVKCKFIENTESSETDLTQNSRNDRRLEISNNLNTFESFHTGFIIDQLTQESKVRGNLVYTLGARVHGDNLVANGAKNQTWSTAQNVAVTLTYPAQGLGAQVTYVVIQVSQSTNLGQSYVVKGGLHQRSISIVVEAYNTLFLNYSAQFYGV